MLCSLALSACGSFATPAPVNYDIDIVDIPQSGAQPQPTEYTGILSEPASVTPWSGIAKQAYDQNSYQIPLPIECGVWSNGWKTAAGNPVYMASYGGGDNIVLFSSNVHPNEKSTIKVANKIIVYLEDLCVRQALPGNLRIYVIPSLNPDGEGRLNPNGVNLNQDFDSPTQPESVGYIELLKNLRHQRPEASFLVVSYHDSLGAGLANWVVPSMIIDEASSETARKVDLFAWQASQLVHRYVPGYQTWCRSSTITLGDPTVAGDVTETVQTILPPPYQEPCEQNGFDSRQKGLERSVVARLGISEITFELSIVETDGDDNIDLEFPQNQDQLLDLLRLTPDLSLLP